jgi:ABC-2 type transport system ATP-binding protein
MKRRTRSDHRHPAAWRPGIGIGSLLAALGLAGGLTGPPGTGLSAVQAGCAPGLHSIAAQPGGSGYEDFRGDILSFDCTPIVYNLFLPSGTSPAHPVYAIFDGPGWSSAGNITPDPELIKDDYAELTWDPRGFGQSGGVAEVDSPEAEGRDVEALIDDVLGSKSLISGAPNPVAGDFVTDQCHRGTPQGGTTVDGLQPTYPSDAESSAACGQPVVGMTSNSYGGGIQYAAAVDSPDIKAIVPGWSWNNLDYSLFPGDVIKLGWDELLFAAGLVNGAQTHLQGDTQGISTGSLGGTGGLQIGGYDPNLYQAEVQALALGYPDQQTLEWFAQRSMAVYGADGHFPDIPTLMVQGTVDTLFNLNEAWANHQEITADQAFDGVKVAAPVKIIAYCGGHVSCPTGPAPGGIDYSATAGPSSPIAPGESASAFHENAMLSWFDTYLRGFTEISDPIEAADLPTLTYQVEDGTFYGESAGFPTWHDPAGATFVTAPFSATLVDHGIPTGTGPLGEDAAVTDGASAPEDPGQVTVPVFTNTATKPVEIVGEPHVNLSVTVDGSSTELFFRLVDENTGEVVDLQTTAQRVDNLQPENDVARPDVPPSAQRLSIDMVGVAYELSPGDTLELQVSTSTDSFYPNRIPAVVSVDGTVSVPTLPQP